MIPSYFEYQSAAKILCGESALERIADELRHLGASAPLLLTDAVLSQNGVAAQVSKALAAEGCPVAQTFTEIPVDSSLEVVNRIARLYRESGCDAIVAVGGGSVIDTAKGARLALSQEKDDILALSGVESLPLGRHISFIVVPTTAGTGSECTGVAVIRNNAQGVKMEFLSPYVEPDVAVLDVRMTERLPARATAGTGMDALCHAIEACTCLQKNPLSHAHGAAAIRLISQHLTEAVEHGSNRQARLAMALAATQAGIAFSNSMVGAAHAIGHALGGVCHVPHAEAMNILLPHVMRCNLSHAAQDYAELLPCMIGWERAAAIPADARAEAMIREVEKLSARLQELTGLPRRLREVGVTAADFPRVAAGAVNDGALIVNPRSLDEAQIIELLTQAY